MRKFLLFLFFILMSFAITIAQTVSGRLITSTYVWERQESLNKSSLQLRGFETVQLDIGKNDFALHTYFNASNDFGTSIGDDPRVRFYNLYLEKKNLFNFTDLKIGRIPIFSGMGVGAIDGAQLKVHPFNGDFTLSGYIGGITPLDNTLKLFSKIADNYMMGFQASAFFIPNTSLSFSYMNRHRKPESYQAIRLDTIFHSTTVLIDNFSAAEQYGSFDVYYSKEFINAYGKADYDFNNDRLYRGELSLRYNPTQYLGLSVEYFHREPRVAYNSIFSVFTQNNTDEFGGGIDYLLLNKYNLFARYSYIKYTDDNASRFTLGVNSSIGSISYSRNFGYIGTQDVISAELLAPIIDRKVILMGGINFSSYKFSEDDLQNVTAIVVGGTWRPLNYISFDLQGQLIMNKIYKNDLRVYFKFSYSFLSKLGIF